MFPSSLVTNHPVKLLSLVCLPLRCVETSSHRGMGPLEEDPEARILGCQLVSTPRGQVRDKGLTSLKNEAVWEQEEGLPALPSTLAILFAKDLSNPAAP